jgi:hypothetical protein
MTSPFQDAAALASTAIDDVFGEQFTLDPMATGVDVNGRGVADPDRAAQTFTATFIDSYARADSGPARQQGVTAEKPGHASSRPQISFDAAALPYAVKRGDRVTRASDGSLYQMAEPRKVDTIRVLVDLNRI